MKKPPKMTAREAYSHALKQRQEAEAAEQRAAEAYQSEPNEVTLKLLQARSVALIHAKKQEQEAQQRFEGKGFFAFGALQPEHEMREG